MPPPLLIDLDNVDLDRVEVSRERIYAELLPHRFEFMVLDGVALVDHEHMGLVAYADIREDSWWVRGHVPGRPLLPGVLMLEMAAQAAALGARLLANHEGFIGFGGVEGCKFRDTVTPPARLYLLAMGDEYRARRIVSRTQGVCEGKLVFEARVTGVTIR